MALADPAALPGVRACPFCADRHLLRLHGWYERWWYGIEAKRLVGERLKARRLYCPKERKTVSLLPDLCMPRRQYGVAVLGYLLECFVVLRLSYLAALRTLRDDAVRHSLVQQLILARVYRVPTLKVEKGPS